MKNVMNTLNVNKTHFLSFTELLSTQRLVIPEIYNTKTSPYIYKEILLMYIGKLCSGTV